MVNGQDLGLTYFTLSLTSALDASGWSKPRPGRFTPGKDPVSIVYVGSWVSGPV
jgi:hypothetical protein